MKDQTGEIIDSEIVDFEDLSGKDAASMVVAFSLSLLIILASSIAILYIWKGEVLVIERPSQALSSWETEYKSLTGVSNESLSELNGEGVVLCVVDSGIDLSHPDFRGLVLRGWLDAVNGINEPYDDEGHGTAMSGIIVADGGLRGISRGVDLLVAKAIDNEGQGDAGSVANSVDWCVQQEADIISLSLGGGQSFGSGLFTTDELEQSVDEALDSGVFVIASAGNDGEDDDGDVGSPGSVEDVICVGGISRTGGIWTGSSEGDNDGRLWPNPILPRNNPDKKPEIVAPGHEVPVLMASGVGNSGWWGWSSGTSAATAWVSGSLALLLQDDPELQRENSSGRESIEGVKVAITQASQMMDGQDSHDDHYGYGHLRIDKLVSHFNDEG
ncbi:MAG: S8 family serine peptidase [Candidatus Thalassarchaeaceae archaeon]|nr:S8 family serine peptidase [Candidatus Thalassarchaeaceae archaeon]